MRKPTDIDRWVASRIRARRHELGLSLNTVALACDVTWQQQSKRELGTNRVSASALWHLAGVLGVPVGWFFEGLER